MIKRDRFELLSAYLDGELTPHERQLVNTWLTQDPTAKCLYNRLLQLRQGMRSCPIEPVCTPDKTLPGVFHAINQQIRMTCMASAGVLAIGTLGLLSGAFGPHTRSLQWAAYSPQPAESVDVLQVALDKPAFPIPQVSADATAASPTVLERGTGSLPTESRL